MTAPRFYCPDLPHPRTSPVEGALAVLDTDETRHAKRVLRLRTGDAVELFDGRGAIATGTVYGFEAGHAAVRIQAIEHHQPASPAVTLAVALPKGSRASEMAAQLSQLGVDQLVPLLTQRGVVDPGAGKLDSLRRVAVESAKQSGRSHLMRIESAVELAAWVESLESSQQTLRLVLHPGGGRPERLPERLARATRILALVGPEGGFTLEELDRVQSHHFERWTVSEHVLRIETAAPAAASVIRYLVKPYSRNAIANTQST